MPSPGNAQFSTDYYPGQWAGPYGKDELQKINPQSCSVLKTKSDQITALFFS